MLHASVLSRLRRSMPGSLVRATSVLLEAAVAADQAAAEVSADLYRSVQHGWTAEVEQAAGALLPLVPWILPPVEELSLPGCSAAAAATAAGLIGSREANLDHLRPQLLEAAAALQHTRFSAPVRRTSLALLCRCLQAVGTSQGAATAERQQAAEALLCLVLSPAMAGELHRSDLVHAETRQLIECALAAATAVLQGGASDAGLGGELAYLAVNLLAYSARVAEVPLLEADPVAAPGRAPGAGRSKDALLAAQHSGWCVALRFGEGRWLPLGGRCLVRLCVWVSVGWSRRRLYAPQSAVNGASIPPAPSPAHVHPCTGSWPLCKWWSGGRCVQAAAAVPAAMLASSRAAAPRRSSAQALSWHSC